MRTKNRFINKACAALLLLSVISLLLVSCGGKYDESDFLGKTSAEIVSEFGKFDIMSKPADSDGLHRNAVCGYTIREKRKGLLDSIPEVLIFIHFDENGIAEGCEEGYRPGG